MNDPSDPRDDLALIAAINAGDHEAFGLLYSRYRDWVVSLAHRLTGDASLALDVLQETFLYVLSKFPGMELRCRFKTFLYPVVRNLSLGVIKKSRRFQSSAEELEQLESTPAAETTRGEGREDLRHALANLSVAQRETLLLRFVDGLSLEEIAQAQGIPLGTVKSRLHKSLGILKQDPRCRELFHE